MKNEFVVFNEITKQNVFKSKPTDKEVFFEGGNIITETDLKGIITYANRKFIKLTGFSKEELIGSPHCINRHPDMPKGAFRCLWKTVFSGKIWKGCVKNLTKDGSFYWVKVYVKPKFDADNNIVGFIATRQQATEAEINEAKEYYEKYGSDDFIDSYTCNYQEELDMSTC